MSVEHELEIAAVAGLAPPSPARARHLRSPGEPCANCATTLTGPYCHACGQLAEDFDHRTVLSLAAESLENLLHVDGRLFRTLPWLVTRPARLTGDYLAGKRASQLPPLRLFLVVVIVFFLAGSLRGLGGETNLPPSHPAAGETRLDFGGRRLNWAEQWLKPRAQYAVAHPRELGRAMEGGLHDLAILFLPLATVMLALLFPFSRRFRIYDHAIFSMHSLSFQGLLLTILTLFRGVPLVSVLALAAPVHLFAHMRGVYRTSVVGTLIRMAILALMSLIAFAVLAVGLVVFGLNAIGTG